MRRSVNESEAVRILPNPVTHTHTRMSSGCAVWTTSLSAQFVLLCIQCMCNVQPTEVTIDIQITIKI